MTVEVTNDLASFHRFVSEQLENGGTKLSPEQVLAMWRERLETIESVRRGLDDVDTGRSTPADQMLDELREETRNS